MASTRTPMRFGATPSASVSASASASASATRVRRTTAKATTPKAKMNLQFSTPSRKPLRVVNTNTPPKPSATPKQVDVSKILTGVYAMVDVRLGADAEIDCSDAVANKLAAMGATILKKKGGRLTHVVVSHFTPQWKEKVAKWHSSTTPIEVVSQLWVNACFTNKQRMKETVYFPVNKGVETATTTSALSLFASGAGGALRGPRSAIKSKRASPTTPLLARSNSATSSLTMSAKNSLVSSTATPTARSTGSRKRRALSMEPTASDAISKQLQIGKKLLKQVQDADVSSVIAAVAQDATFASTPVKSAPSVSNASTPPLSVRLKLVMERRKSIASCTSVQTELEQMRIIKPASSASNDCVSESCSEEEGDAIQTSSGDVTSGETSVVSSGNVPSPATSTVALHSQASATYDIASPSVPAKGEWACSICSSSNAKTRRICKGCKASRVAAATSTTPARRPTLRSATTTPRQRTLTPKAVALAAITGTPSSQSSVASSSRKTSMSTRKTVLPLKRPRLSSDADTNSVRSTNDLFNDERLAPATPSAKKQKTAQPSVKTPVAAKKVGPQRAVIGITGVDVETRGIIECAVHGIDANMSSEPGHRKARVVKSVDYAAGVTHLIVGREIKRTIKVLFAIARGAWIVSEAWAFTSLEQEKWLNEEDFEVAAFPSRRLRELPEQRQVFRSLKFFVGSKIDPSREVLISLIQCAGGEIVNQISVADYCICGDETLFRRATRIKIHGVTPKWVFDSIANLKLEDQAAYGLPSEEHNDNEQ